MRVLLVLVSAVSGCVPPSPSAITGAVCGFPPVWLDAAAAADPPPYPSEACVDAVLDDLSVDLDAVLAADGLADPYGLVRGEDLGGTAIGSLLWAAHALLAADLGPLGRLGGEWATGTFASEVSAVRAPGGEDALGAMLYDYVAANVRSTTIGSRRDAAAGMQRGTLYLYDLPGGIDGAAVLVHEARHRAGPDHVLCGGELSCDADRTGSVAFELAVHQAALDAADDETIREIEQSWIEALEVRILSR
jgi:hypothetical protein